jgi:Flp pilus assembly protein TadD
VSPKSKEPRLWLERGRVYAELGQSGKAAADFHTALQLAPGTDLAAYRWEFRRAGIDEEIVRWPDAFRRLTELRPNDRQLWVALGLHHARRGEWQQAVDVVPRLSALDPSDHWCRCMEATLRLQLGDVDEYRRVCRAMIEKFGHTQDATMARHIAFVCLLDPEAVADRKPLLRLVEKGKPGAKGGLYRYYLLAQGMANYREGQFAQAIDRLSEAGTIGGSPLGLLFMAMAQHRLGQADAARTSLDKARAMLEQKLPHLERGQLYGIDWFDWLRCQIVRREAEKLIEGKKS